MKVGRDSLIEIEYHGNIRSRSSEREFARVDGKKKFKLGTGQMNKRFENKLIGMREEEEKDFDLMLNEVDQHLLIRKKKSEIELDEPPSQGRLIELALPDAGNVLGTIRAVTANDIIIDLNSPLAGKIIHFEVKILDILS
jgi:FKBP-type peptidyl-prolyl cis-trans isomerase 2